MSAVLIVLVLLFIVLALASTRRKRNTSQEYLPAATMQVPRSLFAPPTKQEIAELEAEANRAELLQRASQGEFQTLNEARSNQSLYQEILQALVDKTADLSTLAKFIADQGDLRANVRLARVLIHDWQANPTRAGLAQLLHIAALSDDPETYWFAVESIKHAWDAGQLQSLSGKEIAAAIEVEFWLIAVAARESGAGVALQRYVTEIRRNMNSAKQKNSA